MQEVVEYGERAHNHLGEAMTFQSTSQFRQDEAIWLLTGCKTDGTFVDIGCGQPETHSNTCALERLGWTGVCLDNEKDGPIEWDRKSWFIKADAREFDWSESRHSAVPDYLSVDVDEATPEALRRFLWLSNAKPYLATIEHDFYQAPPKRREEVRGAMLAFGYVPLCLDVYPSGQWKEIVWEDWWCRSGTVMAGLHAKLLSLHNIEEIIATLYDHRAQNSSD